MFSLSIYVSLSVITFHDEYHRAASANLSQHTYFPHFLFPIFYIYPHSQNTIFLSIINMFSSYGRFNSQTSQSKANFSSKSSFKFSYVNGPSKLGNIIPELHKIDSHVQSYNSHLYLIHTYIPTIIPVWFLLHSWSLHMVKT